MAELLEQGLDTATAWRLKERLRWIHLAKTLRAACWRIITRFTTYTTGLIGDSALLESVRKVLATLSTHAEHVVRRWTSTCTNARTEGLNSLFQATRARARGYRNDVTFITMIYMIASPAASMLTIHLKRRGAITMRERGAPEIRKIPTTQPSFESGDAGLLNYCQVWFNINDRMKYSD